MVEATVVTTVMAGAAVVEVVAVGIVVEVVL